MQQKIKKMKIIRVDKNEFETEGGQVFDHPIPLEDVPTVEEFQKIYDSCYQHISNLLHKDDSEDA